MALLRHRVLLIFLFLLFTSFCVLFLPNRQNVNFHSLVQETHQKLSDVIQSTDLKASGPLLSANPTHLTLLGLLPDDPPPVSASSTAVGTALVTAVEAGQADLALGWLRSAQHWLQTDDIHLVLWDLGLGKYERQMIMKQCNNSYPPCTVKQFEWGLWPGHVRDSKLHCHRPIILQTTLRDRGSVIWLDIDHRLTTDDLSTWLTQAQLSGVLSWPEISPGAAGQPGHVTHVATTALTHPKMFGFFNKRKYEDYAFQHMVGVSSLIIINNKNIQENLMLPWLQCVLTEACINPIGAQDTGCRFDKKPQFRYSGCHRYDVSAFNIVLGEIFNFQESMYVGESQFFRKVDQDAKKETGSGNSTTTISSEQMSGLEM